MGATSFLYEMIQICMGASNENDRADFSESEPIHLNVYFFPDDDNGVRND